MKRYVYEGILLLLCAVSGSLLGYGFHDITNVQDEIEEQETKDDTLLREEYDSVFFVEGHEDASPKEPEETEKEEHLPSEEAEQSPTPKPTAVILPSPTAEPQAGGADDEPIPTKIPTLMVVLPSVTPENVIVQEREPAQEEQNRKDTSAKSDSASDTRMTITYPSEIFGQTPIVNREDSYVTYFEFALDLITTLEPEIKREGKKEMTLFTEFMIKALFCGIDVQSVKLNDPIPRDVAGLAVHLAAQVLDKTGTETNAGTVQKYASDVKGCSTAEKKAIVYLYEQGILTVSQEKKFYPDTMLSEKSGAVWMERAGKVWQ